MTTDQERHAPATADGRRTAGERARNAASLLSTVGAAVAGVGLGALLADRLAALAGWTLAGGLVAHVVGMVGNRRAQATEGYRPAAWERAGYWLCWIVIAAIAAAAVARAV